MDFLRPSTLTAALVLVAAGSIPFQPWADSHRSASSLALEISSDRTGLAKVSYDVGRGLNDDDSEMRLVIAGRANPISFDLPGGTLKALKLEPLDRNARVSLFDAQIVARDGKTIERLSPERIRLGCPQASLAVAQGRLVVSASDQTAAPSLRFAFDPPIALPRASWIIGPAACWVGLVALLGILGRFDRSRRFRGRGAWEGLAAVALRHPGWAVALAAALATAGANYPVIFGGKSLLSPNLGTALLYGQLPWVPGFQSLERGNAESADIDALLWAHVPYTAVEHQSLRRDHELPLWDRYNSAGVPLLGQGQSRLGDPLHLIPLLADSSAWAWDVDLLIAKWLFACGIGLCVWHLTRELPAALLLAASSAFIGFYVYRINHPAIFSLGYAPWILYLWLRAVDAGSVRSLILWMAGLVVANVAELNSGTVKEAYVLLGWLNLTGLGLLAFSEHPFRHKMRVASGALAGGALFSMITAPVWYTLYWTLKAAFTAYGTPQAFQLQPGMVLGLFDEVFYRPFQVFANVINPSANVFILLGLIWAGLRWRTIPARRPVSILAIFSLPTALFVFGVIPPGLVTRVPFLGNILHIDNTFSCVLIVVLAVLAGVGWAQALRRLKSGVGRTDAVASLVVLAGIFAIWFGTAQAIVRSAYFDQTWGKLIRVEAFFVLYAISLLAASALLLHVLARVGRRGAWSEALVLLGVLAFAALHWRMGLQLTRSFTQYVIAPADRVDLQADSPAMDAIAGSQATPSRVVGFIDNVFPGWSGIYRLEGLCGPDALVNRYYRQLLDASGIEKVWDWRYRLQDKDLKAVRPFLDLLNVRFYADYPARNADAREGLKRVVAEDMDVYESPTVWPRAFFTDRVAVYDDLATYCSWIRSGDGHPFAAMARADWARLDPAPAVSGELDMRRVQPAADYHLGANTTSFTVTATGPGFIVLTEAYERITCRAALNGREVPCLRLNHAFKGIYVDAAGSYAVSFTYWPRDFTVLLAVSAAGCVLILAVVGTACFGLRRETAFVRVGA
ncbi:MAG TPA: hypothetical protein VGF85_01485 [Opitutaceae bacterium]